MCCTRDLTDFLKSILDKMGNPCNLRQKEGGLYTKLNEGGPLCPAWIQGLTWLGWQDND